MPVFECARCNDMTYSAFSEPRHQCAICGAGTFRVIEGAFAQARNASRDLAPGDHAVLVYDDPGKVAPFCARYLTEGVNARERVVAAPPDELEDEVRALLAPDVAVLVEWHDSHEIYGDFDADRAAATYEALIAEQPATTRILAGPDRAAAESVTPAEWDRYERMSHEIITSNPANVVCLYDTRALSPEVLDVAGLRHGLEVGDGIVRRNERFEYAPA